MRFVLLFIFGASAFGLTCFAQISPTPVINNEIKDNSSIRMRSIQLERVKRDADKLLQPETIEPEARFAQIKEDFESIQKLEIVIIKAYTTGAEINFAKIHESAAEMRKKAIRFRHNFFNLSPESDKDFEKIKNPKNKNVKELIIELDRVLEKFVANPVFKARDVVDSKALEKAQNELVKLIVLCGSLSVV